MKEVIYERDQINYWRSLYLGKEVLTYQIDINGMLTIGFAKCTGININTGCFRLDPIPNGLRIQQNAIYSREQIFFDDYELKEYIKKAFALIPPNAIFDVYSVEKTKVIKPIIIDEDPWTGENILRYYMDDPDDDVQAVDTKELLDQGHLLVNAEKLSDTLKFNHIISYELISYELRCHGTTFQVNENWLRKFLESHGEIELNPEEWYIANNGDCGDEVLKAAKENPEDSNFLVISEDPVGSMDIIEGDALLVEADVLVHQVNCRGVMGAGIAKQIRDRYPDVYEKYRKLCQRYQGNPRSLLGVCQHVDVGDKTICNAFSQDGLSGHGCKTDYDAFAECMWKIASEHHGKTIAMPYKIACGLAGGDWDTIKQIIEEELVDRGHCTVILCKLSD